MTSQTTYNNNQYKQHDDLDERVQKNTSEPAYFHSNMPDLSPISGIYLNFFSIYAFFLQLKFFL